MKSTNLSFVDLCCGAGGFSFGFAEAGWRPLLGVDLCKYSLKTFERNLISKTLEQDLEQKNSVSQILNALGRKRPDAVIAGPPCQGFSQAGPRNPIDPRNHIFVSCARIAVKLQPRIIVLENVPNILKEPFVSHFGKAKKLLQRAGYTVRVHLINAGHLNVPQRRQRVILLATKGIEIDSLTRALLDLARPVSVVRTVSQAFVGLPADTADSKAKTFHNHEPMLHSVSVQEKIARISPGSGPLSYRKLHPGSPAPTLICGNRAMPCHYLVNRTITVREAARIQGFSDRFVFEGTRSSQMTQVANAVPPPLGRKIAELLVRAIRETK